MHRQVHHIGFACCAVIVFTLRQAQHHVSMTPVTENIQPQRKAMRHLAVLRMRPLSEKKNVDQHQRQRHHRQNDVTGQQRQIDFTERRVAG